ncbi:unnamed protein product [Urochloa decumbens]|uniref:Uncharacterized protein n=1 Tax=Urochloa decumbens TaxID=240449 RepID=A0ABC9G4C7_9POAL
MARPPRRSNEGKQKRQRRRRLYILTKHYGDQGTRIYKLNEDDFDSDDAFSEHSEDSGSRSSSEDSGSAYTEDSCFTASDDSDDSSSTYSGDSGFTASDDTKDSGSASSDDSEDSRFTSSDDSDDSSSTASEESDQDLFDSEYDVDSRARRLRHRRLVVRLGSQGGGLPEFLAAGTKIVGLNRSSLRATDVSFAFDSATRVVSAVPPFQSPKKAVAFWMAGGAIYALDRNRRDGVGSQERCVFERLGPEPRGRRPWRWEPLPPPPIRKNLYLELESHAVHPDGATVFLSFNDAGTFSFDGERREWARHGAWLLPFDGEAFYVQSLDAWVGLCKMHTGRLAACRAVEDRSGGDEPRCRCGRDVLFRHNWRRHFDASLVYKGKSKFCLLETVTGEHNGRYSETDTSSCPILLRVVTFRVQHSFDGELCVVDRRSSVYELPPHSSGQKPLAFWV